jgi:Ca2+-binding EF-hand superfamily protein
MTLLSASASMSFVVLIGAIFARAKEGWSILDAFYWSIISCTSVGLGDLSVSNASRPETTVFLLVAVGTFATSAANVVHAFAELEVQRAVSAFVSNGVTEDLILEMDEDGGGSIDKYEFLSYMLVHTGKVSKHEIQGITALFSSLDRDGSGSLDKKDFQAVVAAQEDSPSKKKAQYEGTQDVQKILQIRCFVVWKYFANLLQELKSMLLCQGSTYAKLVDALLAAFFLAVTVLMLHSIDTLKVLPFPMFAPPMLASSIIFFGGAQPPPPAAFVTGTLGAFVLGTVLHQLGASGSIVVQCIAASLLLFFFKLSGSFFVPTVGLAAFIAQSNYTGHSFREPLAYLVAPWSVGHIVLYSSAMLLSLLRQSIRVSFTKQAWKHRLGAMGSGATREAELRKIFDKYDTSGDGALDASELKLALRYVTGGDVDIEDCERIVRSMDTDGNGVIDFHEFMLALDEHA